MATAPTQKLTPEEYLAQDREAEFKSEYLNGGVFPMAGVSFRHAKIVSNLIVELRRNSICHVLSSDLRLHIGATGLFTYPDVMVICGKPRFLDGVFDTVLNPDVLIEVLSKSTKDYDRGEKFESYRTLDSLHEYLTIAQDKVHVEHYVRQPDSRWVLTEYREPSASLEILGGNHPIAAIYEDVDFA
ncbi:MAG: Uma2 family endonuclease [Bryobacteraceae bacterium]